MSTGKDHLSAEERSRNMAKIKQKDSKPEVLLRSLLHRAGYRFRKNVKNLPGKPDIVFSRHWLAVQVRGCFWHQHEGCRAGRLPASNLDYWRPKLEGNVRRDAEKDEALRALGWRVLVIWECELKSDDEVLRQAEVVQSALAAPAPS